MHYDTDPTVLQVRPRALRPSSLAVVMGTVLVTARSVRVHQCLLHPRQTRAIVLYLRHRATINCSDRRPYHNSIKHRIIEVPCAVFHFRPRLKIYCAPRAPGPVLPFMDFHSGPLAAASRQTVIQYFWAAHIYMAAPPVSMETADPRVAAEMEMVPVPQPQPESPLRQRVLLMLSPLLKRFNSFSPSREMASRSSMTRYRSSSRSSTPRRDLPRSVRPWLSTCKLAQSPSSRLSRSRQKKLKKRKENDLSVVV